MAHENFDGLSSEELMNAIFKDDLDDEGLIVDIEDSGLDVLSPLSPFGLAFAGTSATLGPEYTLSHSSDDPSSSVVDKDRSFGGEDKLQASSGETTIFIGGRAKEVSQPTQEQLNSVGDVKSFCMDPTSTNSATTQVGSRKADEERDLASGNRSRSNEATNVPSEQMYIDFSLMKEEDIEDKHKPLVGHTFDSIVNTPAGSDASTLKEVSIHIKPGRDIKTFPMKLHEVLERLEYKKVISWLPHGRSFVIHDTHALVSEALPRFFNKAVKYTSFTRQLQLWGFKRVIKSPDAGSYFHQLFLRGKPELAKRMVVRRSKGDSNQKGFLQAQTLDPDFYALALKRPLPEIKASSSKLPPLQAIKPLNVDLPAIQPSAKTWGFSKNSGPTRSGSHQALDNNHSGHGQPLAIQGDNMHNFFGGQQQNHQQQRQPLQRMAGMHTSNRISNTLNSRDYSSSQTVSNINPSPFGAHGSLNTSAHGYPPTMPQSHQQHQHQQAMGFNGVASPGQYLYPNYQGQGAPNNVNHQQGQSMMQSQMHSSNQSVHQQSQAPMSNHQVHQRQFLPMQQQQHQQSYMPNESFSAPATPFSSQHGSSNGFFQQYASQSQHSMHKEHPMIHDRIKRRRHSLYEGASKQQAQVQQAQVHVQPAGEMHSYSTAPCPADDPFEPTALDEIIASSNQAQHPPPFQMPMQRRNSC
uniref:HSF-type DNA-binding domain-containing protein n=1 Tax=Leptocylindrus danicus TaxID=163516 RepID=A0A7S2LRW2_9STRA